MTAVNHDCDFYTKYFSILGLFYYRFNFTADDVRSKRTSSTIELSGQVFFLLFVLIISYNNIFLMKLKIN